jgi:hypothetical protein
LTKYTKKAAKFFEGIREIDGIIEKKCTQCNTWKPFTNEFYYYKNKSKPEKGFSSECIICASERSKINRSKNHERQKANQRAWKQRNSESEAEKARQWREENKEYKQQYQLDYQRKHPEKMLIYAQNRRHKNHKITSKEWNACLKYFNHRCAYCGLPIEKHYNMYAGKLRWENLNKEHVIHNGSNDLTNCVPSCKSCNDKKWEYSLDEWYTINNINYTQDRYDKIIQWLMEDCFKYIEDKKPKKAYNRKVN